MATGSAPSTRGDEDEKVVQRKVYFHVQKERKVRVKEAVQEAVNLPHLKNVDSEAYFKIDYAYQQQESMTNPNNERRISSPEREQVYDNLRKLLAAVSRESLVEGITFQARFGSMFFVLPRSNTTDTNLVSTQSLQEHDIQKVFLFRVPFDVQYFLQTSCGCLDSTVDRYKIKFKYYTDDVSQLLQAASQIEEKDGIFTHLWTRVNVNVREANYTGARTERVKLDIVRPGRNVDIRILSLLRTPCTTEDDAVYSVGETIAKSMTLDPSGKLSVQVAGRNFCLDIIRKKTMRKYKWIDPGGRNLDWIVTECCAKNSYDKKLEYLEMRRDQKFTPITVDFDDEIKEIYFNGSTHVGRPNENSDIKVSTPDQLFSDFEEFVAASFAVADLLENTSAAHVTVS